MQNGRSLVVSRNSFNYIRRLAVLLQCDCDVEKKEEGAISSVHRRPMLDDPFSQQQKKDAAIFVVLFILICVSRAAATRVRGPQRSVLYFYVKVT